MSRISRGWQYAGPASRTGETFARGRVRTSTVPPEHAPLPFGKRKGNTLPEVYEAFPGYVRWLSEQTHSDSPRVRVFAHAARAFLAGREQAPCCVSDPRTERKRMPRHTHSKATRGMHRNGTPSRMPKGRTNKKKQNTNKENK